MCYGAVAPCAPHRLCNTVWLVGDHSCWARTSQWENVEMGISVVVDSASKSALSMTILNDVNAFAYTL